MILFPAAVPRDYSLCKFHADHHLLGKGEIDSTILCKLKLDLAPQPRRTVPLPQVG
jgi:hypothetical protein